MRITRIEVVIVFLILVCCAVLIIPAIQAARETARKHQCGNNLKQLCMGLQNYHDTFLYLPYGARNRTVPPDYDKASWGPSWYVAISSFCEASPFPYAAQKADLASPENDYVSAALRATAPPPYFSFMYCAASDLREFQKLGGHQMMVPSYAGIMGAAPMEEAKSFKGNVTTTFDPRAVAGPFDGWAAGNGMLLVNESLTMAACNDGAANTMVIGEVSDWYYTDRGEPRNPALSIADAGDGLQDGAGWIAGTNLGFSDRKASYYDAPRDRPGQIVLKTEPPIPEHRVCNLISIHHPVGMTNRLGARDTDPNWGSQGIGRCGLNNPLLSAHPGGAMVGFLDGHVHLMNKQTTVEILKKLSARDDGGVTLCDGGK